MTRQDIQKMRNMLRKLQSQKVDEMRNEKDEEFGNQALAMMETGAKAGEHSVAAKLLRMLPEPEMDVVLDWWALNRVDRMNIDFMTGDFSQVYHEKYTEAKEVIEDRIEITQLEINDKVKRYELKDPISKQKMQVSIPDSEQSDEEIRLQQAKESLVNSILERGER